MQVTCWISPRHDLYHASAWLAGLHTLHRAGKIRLRLRAPGAGQELLGEDPLALALRVETPSGHRQLVVDLRDQSALFSERLLEWADLYFKRSYHGPDLDLLGAQQRKVLPLGMNYACRTSGSLAALLPALLRGFAASPSASLPGVVRSARYFRAIPPRRLFERLPSQPAEPRVLFQTRVWEEGETGDEPADAVNEGRVALVRALRKAFGPRFVGGLVPTPLAESRYPELVVRTSYRKTEYIRMSSRQLVGVYTRGLHHSTAWKLPEYLAASQCIVAEPPRNALPSPLQEGIHYLGFSNPHECVSACQKLLEDPQRASKMREANHGYYADEVRPDTLVYQRLQQAMAST